MKRKKFGWMVMEACEDFEQALGLITGDALPPGGVLAWTNGPRFVFQSPGSARAAIKRTEHLRLAFGDTAVPGVGFVPARQFCRVVALEMAEDGGGDGAE